jgi:hypothetical protein
VHQETVATTEIARTSVSGSILSTAANAATSTAAPLTLSSASALAAENTMMSTTSPSASVMYPQVHLFANSRENSYLPPHERNFTLTGKGKEHDAPAYHMVAPVQNDHIADDIFKCSMKAPLVTLSAAELLSLLPEIRTHWKEHVTPCCIQIQPGNNVPHLINKDLAVINDPFEMYLNTIQRSDNPKPFVAAKESHSIRSVTANIQGSNPIESIVNPSSSIIVMSEEFCHRLGLVYDESVIIELQSANSSINHSLGLIPCEISGITLYVQIHIIRNPAYDVLLGRPFNVVTESNVKNWQDKSQTITIFDPNSAKVSGISTFPRSTNCPCIAHGNFRD